MTAASEQEAYRRLTAQGLTPTKIESDETILVRGAPIEATWEFGRATLSGNVSTPEKLQLIEKVTE